MTEWDKRVWCTFPGESKLFVVNFGYWEKKKVHRIDRCTPDTRICWLLQKWDYFRNSKEPLISQSDQVLENPTFFKTHFSFAYTKWLSSVGLGWECRGLNLFRSLMVVLIYMIPPVMCGIAFGLLFCVKIMVGEYSSEDFHFAFLMLWLNFQPHFIQLRKDAPTTGWVHRFQILSF